ncbi:hypothetical protein AVEN_199740-1 [Araneus ventricosus]|uniref:Uncharacterized protein n=1 Tax=Araneus ventricosus TaxID=182803 RepID=A0A4Y2U525_ARAVE|nr:hypothetical protein AVEN_199740-1 [Araneus ventricosus]
MVSVIVFKSQNKLNLPCIYPVTSNDAFRSSIGHCESPHNQLPLQAALRRPHFTGYDPNRHYDDHQRTYIALLLHPLRAGEHLTYPSASSRNLRHWIM